MATGDYVYQQQDGILVTGREVSEPGSPRITIEWEDGRLLSYNSSRNSLMTAKEGSFVQWVAADPKHFRQALLDDPAEVFLEFLRREREKPLRIADIRGILKKRYGQTIDPKVDGSIRVALAADPHVVRHPGGRFAWSEHITPNTVDAETVPLRDAIKKWATYSEAERQIIRQRIAGAEFNDRWRAWEAHIVSDPPTLTIDDIAELDEDVLRKCLTPPITDTNELAAVAMRQGQGTRAKELLQVAEVPVRNSAFGTVLRNLQESLPSAAGTRTILSRFQDLNPLIGDDSFPRAVGLWLQLLPKSDFMESRRILEALLIQPQNIAHWQSLDATTAEATLQALKEYPWTTESFRRSVLESLAGSDHRVRVRQNEATWAGIEFPALVDLLLSSEPRDRPLAAGIDAGVLVAKVDDWLRPHLLDASTIPDTDATSFETVPEGVLAQVDRFWPALERTLGRRDILENLLLNAPEVRALRAQVTRLEGDLAETKSEVSDREQEIRDIRRNESRNIRDAERDKGLHDMMGRVQGILALLDQGVFQQARSILRGRYEVDFPAKTTVPFDREFLQDESGGRIDRHFEGDVFVLKPYIALASDPSVRIKGVVTMAATGDSPEGR